MQTEYLRSMNTNYERILLDKQPEEKRYQYCILSRGGIRGLLPCSLRYLNGLAYLYYDITSKQNITRLFGKRCITRLWLKDFMWSFSQIRQELGRFLLDSQNIIWYPEQIFQDLESNIFSFLYIPYYEENNGFLQLLEYLVERIDYEDEVLVDCVYKMYEQFERNGMVYLQEQIFEDAKVLNCENIMGEGNSAALSESDISSCTAARENRQPEETDHAVSFEPVLKESNDRTVKKGLRYLLEGRKRKYRDETENYRRDMEKIMEESAVAEETHYEEYGKTIYMEATDSKQEAVRRLYTPEGRIVIQLDRGICTIGKKRNEVDLVLEDFAVSRIHARISKEPDGIYLEDLNSTNGTYISGIRMQPYEKSRLEIGDEIKIGKTRLIFR